MRNIRVLTAFIFFCFMVIFPSYLLYGAQEGKPTSDELKECLNKKELQELETKKAELKKLKDFGNKKNHKLEGFEPDKIAQRGGFEKAIADTLPDNAPTILSVIFKAREYAEKMGEQKYKLEKDRLSKIYRNFLEDNFNYCGRCDDKEFLKKAPLIFPSWVKFGVTTRGHEKTIKTAFMTSWKFYCREVNKVTGRIEALENKCFKVPDLIGKSFYSALDILDLNSDQKDLPPDLVFLLDAIERPDGTNQGTIYEQEPAPGSSRRARSSVKVRLHKVLKKLILEKDPPGAVPSPGNDFNYSAKAEYLHADKEDVSEKALWDVKPSNVTRPLGKGRFKIASQALDGDKFTITAYYKSGGAEDDANVTVTVKGAKPSKLTIEKKDPAQVPQPGKSIELRATASYPDGNPVDVTENILCEWSTDEKSIGSVSKGIVTINSTAKHNDRITIKATYPRGKDYRKTATLTLKVRAIGSIEIREKGVSKRVNSLEIHPGEEKRLVAVVKYPGETPKTIPAKDLIWSSTDSSIATVDTAGKTTGIDKGSAEITAKFGEFKDTIVCKVLPRQRYVKMTVFQEGDNGVLTTDPIEDVEVSIPSILKGKTDKSGTITLSGCHVGGKYTAHLAHKDYTATSQTFTIPPPPVADPDSAFELTVYMKSPVAKIKLYPEGPLKILPGEQILFTVEKIFAAGGSEKIPAGKIKWVTGGTIFIPNAMDQKTGTFTAHGTGGGTAEVTAYYGKMSDKVSIDIQTWRRTVKITVYEKNKNGNPTTIPVENALVYNSYQKGNTDHLGVVVFKDSLPGSGGYTVKADGYTTLNSPAVKVPSVGSAAAAKIPIKATFYIEKDFTPVELILDPKLFRATDLGETFQLRASVVYKDGSKEDVTDKTSWSSDDRRAATVTKDGLVTIMDTANDGATTTITASYTGFKRSAQSSVTATCEINVTLGDSIVDFTVLPSSPKVDEKTTFAVNFKTSRNVKSADTFVWYLRKHGEAGKQFATGPTISYVFKDKDDYYIELKVMRSGEEKGNTEKMISPETKPIIAKGYKCEWRGRMDGKKLTITKHNWNGQKKKFSEQPDRTETYYSVDSWDLRTGQIEQAPIFNPGYLVYASNNCIHYAILSYEVEQIHAGIGGKTQPNYEFSGTVSPSCGKLATKNLSLGIGSVLSRGFTVSWNSKDGAACRATIERYTGNIEKDSFLCEKGKPLVAPIIVFEPKNGIDTNTSIIFSVTNAGDNPGSIYAWTLDGKVRGETSSGYSTKLSKGTHSISVSAENRFGAKKAGNSLTISVKEAKKKKTGITPEDIVQLIKEGKAEEAYKLLMGMDDDASETLLSKLSDEEVEAIMDAGEPGGEVAPSPQAEKVTADEISELIKEGKAEEANEILMTLPDEAAGEILSELTENEVEEIMGASEPEEMGKPSESGTPPEPEAIAQTVSNLIKSGKEKEAGALLLETPDEITEEILNSLTPEEVNALTSPLETGSEPTEDASLEPGVTAGDIKTLLESGKFDEAGNLLMEQDDNITAEIISGLTDKQIEKMMNVIEEKEKKEDKKEDKKDKKEDQKDTPKKKSFDYDAIKYDRKRNRFFLRR